MYKQNSPYIMNSSFVFVCSKNVGKNRITVFIILNFPLFAHGTKYTCILLSDKNNIVCISVSRITILPSLPLKYIVIVDFLAILLLVSTKIFVNHTINAEKSNEIQRLASNHVLFSFKDSESYLSVIMQYAF